MPTLGVVVTHESAPVAAGVVVEVAAPGGDEPACVHFVVVLDLGRLTQVSCLLNPLADGAERVSRIEHIEVAQNLLHECGALFHGGKVVLLHGAVKLLLLVVE